MERRSTRGRTSSTSTTATTETPTPTKQSGSARESSASAKSMPALAPPAPPTPVAVEEVEVAPEPVPAPDVPDIGGEEVVLNRRGMPARQRKRNRFYFDDEIMVTHEVTRRSGGGNKSPGKKIIKSEPVEDVEPETITADIPDYEVEHEVEIPSVYSMTEELETSGTSGRHRSRSSAKGSSRAHNNKKSDSDKHHHHHKSHKHESHHKKSTKASKNQQPETPERSKSSSKSKDRGSRGDQPSGSSRSPQQTKMYRRELSHPNFSKREYLAEEARAKKKEAHDAVQKVINKVKNEPGASSAVFELEKREKQMREGREGGKASKGSKQSKADRQQKERAADREYGAVVIPSKSRSSNKRDSSPSPSDFMGLIPGVGAQEDVKQAIDKKTAQDISLRLRNLLKLPKAHKWVCYEWFYSNIDKVLFEGENDFQICLKESFPQLKARKLTRVEWCKIRRLMGKPRRCSQAFFDEEREELGRRRQKIRMIQQRKITDFNYKELPDEIPLQLTIGTKVTARLRRPQDGLFTGTIEGVDTSNNTYRITFDRTGLGTHSIPDYEVLSNDPVETVSTSSFALKIPRRSFGFGTAAFKFQNPGLIGEDGIYRFPTSPFPVDGMLGGFPIRLLDMIVRLSKLLKAKREKILQLKELNVEAEKMRSYARRMNSDYRLRYARCILDLDSMNKEMAMYVEGIQTYCLEQIAPDHGANQMIVPEQVQEQCRQEANMVVDTYNTKQNRRSVHGQKSLNLVAQLTSLLLQVKTLSNGDRNLYELKSVKETMKDIKASLEGKNVQLFQDGVEIPMNRIQAGLCMSNKPY